MAANKRNLQNKPKAKAPSIQSDRTKKTSTKSRQNKSTLVQESLDSHVSNTDRNWLRQAIVIFVLALLTRMLHFWAMSKSPIYEVLIGDAWQYDRWARQIAGGEWVGKDIFYQTPLYPYLLGLVYALFGHSVWMIRVLQALMGSFACVLLSSAGNRFFDHRVGWVAGLVLAVYPPAIFFDGILQKAALDLLLMCALLWMISRQQKRLTVGGSLAIGCLLGLLILNRENAWVFFLVLLVWIGWLKWVELRSWGGWIPVAGLLAGMLLTLGPVGIRNYYVGGEFLLTTSQMGPNFYIGNHRGAPGRYVSLRPDRGDPRFERTDARILAEQSEGKSLTPREVSQYWMRRSIDDITADPAGWLRLLAWKWFLTWSQLELVDGEGIRVHAWHSPILMVPLSVLHFGVLSGVAAAGIWFSRRQLGRLWILHGLTWSFALAVTAFYVFARYRYPLLPMVTLFAANGVVQAVCIGFGTASNRWRELFVAGALSGAVGIATCWPLPSLHSDEVTYFSVGTALNDQGRYEEAAEQLKKSLELKTDFVQAYINLATTHMKLNRWDAAATYLQQALEIQSNNPVALQNLATVRIEQKRYDEAEEILKQTLEIDPYMTQSLCSMSRLLMRQGNRQAAIQMLQKAVRIDQQSAEAHAELAMAWMADRDFQSAADSFESAYQLNPDNILVANNFAWLLATGPDGIRNGQKAVQLSEKVCQAVEYQAPEFLDTLAAAYAETGQFQQATQYAEEALFKLDIKGASEQLNAVRNRIELYRRGKAYRDIESP